MRIAAIILGLIGAIWTLVFGYICRIDFNQTTKILGDPMFVEEVTRNRLYAYGNLAYALIICGVLSFVTILLVTKINKKISSVLLIACGLIPSLIIFKTMPELSTLKIFLPGLFLITAAILILFTKKKELALEDIEHFIDS